MGATRGAAVGAGAASASPTTASTSVRHRRDTSTYSIGCHDPPTRLPRASTRPVRIRPRGWARPETPDAALRPELLRVALGPLRARVPDVLRRPLRRRRADRRHAGQRADRLRAHGVLERTVEGARHQLRRGLLLLEDALGHGGRLA